MQYTDKEMAKLINEVEQAFSAQLNKAEKLAKSEEMSPKKEKDHESMEDESMEEEHKEAPKHEEHESMEHEEHEGEEHSMDPEEKEYMDKMYHSMTKHELKAHHESIKSALAKCGEMQMEEDLHPGSKEGPDSKLPAESKEVQKSEDCIESCAPGKTPGAKSEDSKANGEKINKSEHERRNGGNIEASAAGKTPGAKSEDSNAHGDKINKSESTKEIELLKSEFQASKAKNEELKKNFEAVSEFLTKLVKKTVPQGKAIYSMDEVVAKSESSKEQLELSTKEITAILTKKTADATLAKSERELINAYYNGASLNSIAHLLK